jgi:probable HAF family extracellular repeat protein
MEQRNFPSALWLGSLGLLTSLAGSAQGHTPRYSITDLGTGSPFSQAAAISDNGLIAGVATLPNGAQHAVIWLGQHRLDIAGAGLGGPNSAAFGINETGQVDGQAETGIVDPNKENFCDYGTGYTCVPFLWRFGVLSQLRTLGGNNATVGNINAKGEVSGIAETATVDPSCPGTLAANGDGPQTLHFEAVIWGPKLGEVRELHPLPGDSVGEALWVNDKGQAVGTTGTCANTVLPPFVTGPHAVLWEKDGSVVDLGNLGGTSNPAALIGNVAFAISNSGQVTGASTLPGSAKQHAFLWTKATGMRDLGGLPGDDASAGLSVNDRGIVVGASNAGGVLSPTGRAALWQNGRVFDLNDLVTPDTSLFLLTAFGINDRDEIVGFGVTETGDLHAFFATPCQGDAANANGCKTNRRGPGRRPNGHLSENARKFLAQMRVGSGSFGHSQGQP